MPIKSLGNCVRILRELLGIQHMDFVSLISSLSNVLYMGWRRKRLRPEQ